jgi:hypothetical protein
VLRNSKSRDERRSVRHASGREIAETERTGLAKLAIETIPSYVDAGVAFADQRAAAAQALQAVAALACRIV